jgi:hypothetical protein
VTALVTLSLLALFVVGMFGLTALPATAAPDGMVRENLSDAVERELTSARRQRPGPR